MLRYFVLSGYCRVPQPLESSPVERIARLLGGLTPHLLLCALLQVLKFVYIENKSRKK